MKVYIMRKTIDWFEVQVPAGTAMDKAVDVAKDMLAAGDERIFPLNHRHHGVTDFYMNEADVKVQLLVSAHLDLSDIDEFIISEVHNLIYDAEFLKYSPYQSKVLTNGDLLNEGDDEDERTMQTLSETVYDAVYSMLVNENIPEDIAVNYREELGLL
jgi:hypothetical protein